MVLLSVQSEKGHRNYMEDRYAYIERNGIIIAMVCDGHGGYQASTATAKELPEMIYKAVAQRHNTNVEHAVAIRTAIIQWSEKLKDYHSGTTLTGIAAKNGIVYIYNVGDSRTCIRTDQSGFIYMLHPMFNETGEFMNKIYIDYFRPQFFCTADHDSESGLEVLRVNHSGGKIINKRLNGILSVTRALGDSDIGPGLSGVPDVYWFSKSILAGPILMYSDGIYEPQRGHRQGFDNQYLYNLATSFDSETLVKYAYENGSEDNLTAMLTIV